jgi:zinc transporter ZupT
VDGMEISTHHSKSFFHESSCAFSFACRLSKSPPVPYISQIDKPFLGALLSFSASALVYVGATHLLPRAETEKRNGSVKFPGLFEKLLTYFLICLYYL